MSLKSRGEWILPEGKIEGDILNYLLKKRGIEDVEGYLSPSLKDVPSSLTPQSTEIKSCPPSSSTELRESSVKPYPSSILLGIYGITSIFCPRKVARSL